MSSPVLLPPAVVNHFLLLPHTEEDIWMCTQDRYYYPFNALDALNHTLNNWIREVRCSRVARNFFLCSSTSPVQTCSLTWVCQLTSLLHDIRISLTITFLYYQDLPVFFFSFLLYPYHHVAWISLNSSIFPVRKLDPSIPLICQRIHSKWSMLTAMLKIVHFNANFKVCLAMGDWPCTESILRQETLTTSKLV